MKREKEKENWNKKEIESEKIEFSRENAAENSFKADTRFALIPCYETWHPWKEREKYRKVLCIDGK
jgi:hypothetical protein